MYFDQSPAAELANPNLFSFAFGPRYQRQSYRLVVRLKEWLIADWLSRVSGCFVVKLLAYATPNTYLGLLWLLADCHGWPHTDIATNTSSCTFQKVQNLLWIFLLDFSLLLLCLQTNYGNLQETKAIARRFSMQHSMPLCNQFHYQQLQELFTQLSGNEALMAHCWVKPLLLSDRFKGFLFPSSPGLHQCYQFGQMGMFLI